MPPGDKFAIGFWKPISRLYGVPWPEFLEWELWQIAGALELDKRAPTEAEVGFMEQVTTDVRAPSTKRRG